MHDIVSIVLLSFVFWGWYLLVVCSDFVFAVLFCVIVVLSVFVLLCVCFCCHHVLLVLVVFVAVLSYLFFVCLCCFMCCSLFHMISLGLFFPPHLL